MTSINVEILIHLVSSRAQTTDVKMAVFQCPLVAWQFQTPIRFQAVEQGIILEWEAEEALVWMRSMSGGIHSTKKWRAETLQPGLEFDNFKHRFKIGYSECISWLNGLFFGGGDWVFLKKGVKTYLMAPVSLFKFANFFVFWSIVCGQVHARNFNRPSIPRT